MNMIKCSGTLHVPVYKEQPKNPKEKIIEDYVIVYSPQLKNLKYDKNQYKIIDFGSFVVLNKK